MKPVAIAIICMLCCLSTFAAEFRGRVMDETGGGIALVYIKNANSGEVATSDTGGYFVINAAPGERLVFTHLAYQTYYYAVEYFTGVKIIKLYSRDVQLGEVKILSEMAKFRRDSANNHEVYHKELGYATSKTKKSLSVGTGQVGIGFEGIFSELALRASGKKKRFKDFAATMQADEEERFIKIRYNVPIVSLVTGLTDSAAANFIVRHPIPYDFARAATDLELKSWILYEYKH
ncbi:MAG: hypothetical protein V4649_17980 [Bacteroidota bacterium]